MKNFLISAVILVFVSQSCSNSSELRERLRAIKEAGNSNPRLALQMLDSVKTDIYGCDEHTRNTFSLLNIRLNDKADIIPSSDIEIRKVLDYFSSEGSPSELQEAYYYAGSVYRDLRDTPKSLLFFLKSVELAESSGKCDSTLLINAYSNLSHLYYNVQDYRNALMMAIIEDSLSVRQRSELISTKVCIGNCYLRIDSTESAKKCFTQVMAKLDENSLHGNEDVVSSLLYDFSRLSMRDEATRCYTLMRHLDSISPTTDNYLAMAEYFKCTGVLDSAEYYYKRTMELSDSYSGKYDASRCLFRLYYRTGHGSEANKYAERFVDVSDSINLGLRQEQAASVNNLYQYQRHEREELELREASETKGRLLLYIITAFTLTVIILLTLYFYKKSRTLKTELGLLKSLGNLRNERDTLEGEISKQKSLNGELLKTIRQKADEIEGLTAEIKRYDMEYEASRNQLEDKIEQNKSLIRLLDQANFGRSNKEVIDMVKKAAEGMYDMKSTDWDEFTRTAKTLHPGLEVEIRKKFGRCSQKQLLVCYLLKAGITSSQIQKLLSLPRTTAWRWITKLDDFVNS